MNSWTEGSGREQHIIISTAVKEEIESIAQAEHIKKLLLVCDGAFPFLSTYEEYKSIQIPYVVFDRFTPNPLYEDVCKGVECFRKEGCDAILAIGGGSAMDVAKCIKLFCRMPDEKNYLTQEFTDNDVKLLAVPTTSGTGSESTRYAVVYYEGKKQSVTHESIRPSYALLDSRNLQTVPLYQKKCTMLDALCQSIESWWSVNATQESRRYSGEALSLIMKYMDMYLENSEEGNAQMMLAANYAGRAIHITQTTAAHAMSYKLTSLYGIPHGRAVSMCLPFVWEYMEDEERLAVLFSDIAKTMNCQNVPEAIARLKTINKVFFKDQPAVLREEDLELLADSVNPVRLKNNPVQFDKAALYQLYADILKENNN